MKSSTKPARPLNYIPTVRYVVRTDKDGRVRTTVKGGGSAIDKMSLADWAAKRRRARQTHPGKRGKI